MKRANAMTRRWCNAARSAMNLSRIIEHWALMTPVATAFHFESRQLSYAALWQRTLRATAYLHANGIGRGDRVAFLGLNHPDFIALLMACARLGAITVPLNFRLAVPELAALLQHAEPRFLLVDQAMAGLGRDCAQAAGIATQAFGALCENQASLEDAALLQALTGNDHDAVLIVSTSGTTGRPKGALHTQANLLWNIQSAIASQDLAHEDRLLLNLPMFHVGGLCIQTLPLLSLGASVTLHARVDPGRWLQDCARYRPTISLLVPAVLKSVIEHADFATTDLSSLKRINCGSSVVPHSLINAIHARGIPVIQVYGATETGPVSIALRVEDAMSHVGSCGKAALHVEARLMAGGAEVARGQTGEVWLRGHNIVQSYWRDADNPAFENGWFKTGDLARQDEDGFYYIVGRLKEMIISGGENIYPAEIENLLADCPALQEAAVVGVADEKWGEVAVAAVVRKPGMSIDEAGVLALFDGKLAKYKHPRRVVFVESLPKTALGKVQKAALKIDLR